jgi:hypothetical protein
MVNSYIITRTKKLDEWTAKEVRDADSRLNYRRLRGPELEALQRCVAGISLIEEAAHVLRKVQKEAGIRPSFEAAAGIATEAARKLVSGITVQQRKSMLLNSAQMKVSITPYPVAGGIVMDANVLQMLCKQLMLHYCDIDCTCDKQTARQCPFRKAFDQVPGLEFTGREEELLDGICPYRMRGWAT